MSLRSISHATPVVPAGPIDAPTALAGPMPTASTRKPSTHRSMQSAPRQLHEALTRATGKVVGALPHPATVASTVMAYALPTGSAASVGSGLAVGGIAASEQAHGAPPWTIKEVGMLLGGTFAVLAAIGGGAWVYDAVATRRLRGSGAVPLRNLEASVCADPPTATGADAQDGDGVPLVAHSGQPGESV